MTLRFVPPSLKGDICRALDILEGMGLEVDSVLPEIIDPRDPEFDPEEWDDDDLDALDDVRVTLPDSYEYGDLKHGDLLALSEDVQGSELEAGLWCWMKHTAYARVEPTHSTLLALHPLSEGLNYPRLAFRTTFKVGVDGAELQLGLTRGITPFGFCVARDGLYDSDYPPSFHEEWFVQVKGTASVSKETARHAVAAYLFELECSHSIGLSLSPRLSDWWDAYPEDELEAESVRLRPLLSAPSLREPLDLYNSAVATDDPQFQVLGFVKLLEYVSITVVRSHLNEVVIRKLLDRRALTPDAGFVAQLQETFDRLKTLRKDREALRLAVEQCCDALLLAHVAPPFLQGLASLTEGSPEKDRKAGLTQLSASLSSTRNQIAHAKASYEPTGDEAPPDQLGALAECARVAAQQAIRWYAVQHESMRVTLPGHQGHF